MEAIQQEVKRTGIDINDLEGSLKRLDEEASASASQFLESSGAAGKLKEELRGLAEGGASADVLIAKARELANAQRKAANDGADALTANQKYWTALNLAGEDISEVQKKHAELSQSYTDMAARAAATETTVSEYTRRLDEEKQKLQETREKADEARKSTDGIKDSTDKAAKSSKDFADKLNAVKEGAGNLPGPLGDALSGMNGLTKATLRFIATPLGATLALISATLATITSWFKRTEEGQNALATGSAYFTQVLGSLLDVADDAGEWLYRAFTKPKAAAVELVDFVKGQVMNRLKALGEVAQGIWKILHGDFSEGFSQLGNGYLQGLTGVQNVTQKVGSWMSDTNKKAQNRVSIAQRQNKLDADERKHLVERARLERDISELRQKAYDNRIPEKERSKAIKDAQDKTRKMYDEEMRLARERYEIIRDTNSLTHSNKEDKKKEAEAEAELYRLESQRAIALKGLMREQNRVDSSEAKSARAGARIVEAQERMAELLDRQKRGQARKAVDLQFSTREAEIKALSDGTDKTIRQIELDRDREIEAIKRSYEDLKIARIEEAKKMYEADPKNKGTNFYESSIFKGTDWETTYTKEEKANREALEKAVNVEADKRLKEQREKEQQYLYDYLKEWGSIEQQKEATAREYDQKIADEGNAIQRESLRRQKEQALSELDFKELQQSIDWERVFVDLDRYSTAALRELKENLRTALDAKDITVENAKVLAEKINEVDDRIISRSDAWASLLPILRERKKLTEEAVTAEQEYQRALSKNIEAQGRMMKLQQQATGILRANGKDDSDVSVDGLKRLLSTLDPASDAFTELTKIVKELEVADKALVGAISEEEKARRKQASIDSQLKNFNSIGKAFENGRNAAGGDIQYGLQQLQELPELIDAIGLHDTEFGQGVEEFVSGTSNFASAIQKFQSGDFVGAATDAIKGIQDYGHLIERVGGFSFSGSNADEVRAENNRLIAANENLTKSIDSLRGVIDKKYGRDAAEAAEKAIEQQREKNENILKEFANEMGYHSAHHSNAYYYDIGQENADKLNEFLKGNGIDKSVRAGVWEDLMNLTPEEMKLVSEQLGDVWNVIISQGKYDRPYEILDEYIEQAGKISEINDQLVQRMTGTSADSVFDDFLSSLYDLANDSEEVFGDMADNWQNMVNKMAIDNLVGSQFQDKIKKWAEEVAKKTEAMSNGELSKSQYLADLDELQKQREGYLKEAQELMETYKSAGIIKATGNDANSDKSASALGLDKISYEQADQIQGQLTAIQIAQGQGNATAELILLNIQTMSDMIQPGMSELRSLAITRNEYLLDIKKSSREMLETFSEKIDNVERAIKELQ